MTVHKVKLDKNYSWFIQTLAVVPGDILLYESKNVNGHPITRYVYVVMEILDPIFDRFLSMKLLSSIQNKIFYTDLPFKQ